MRINTQSLLASLLGMAAVLAGCKVGPDFKRPDPPAADRYTSQKLQVESGASANLDQQIALGATLDRDWWRMFQSDALDAVVKRALEGNRTLVAANATLAQTSELARAQAGSLYPQVNMTAGLGRQKYGAEFFGASFEGLPPFTYYALGPTVSYALDYTGGTTRSVEQQYAQAEYQRQQLNAAYLMVSGNAVMQCLRIALLRGEIATVEAILEEDRQNQKLVQVAFEAGSVSRVDVVSAESQLASDATLLPSLRQELSVARHALSIIMGQLPAADTVPTEFELSQVTLPRNLPVSLPSELVHRRPDILASEAQLHAATAAVGVATSNLYPHIVLTGSLTLQSTVLGHLFEGQNNAYSGLGSLTAPLFDGGTLRAQKRAAVDAMQASAANYEQTVLTAFGQVADSLEALDHDAEQLDAQAHAQSAARENVDLTQELQRGQRRGAPDPRR
jgi:NodT family efflux transporter outer membrane factor (OMF) lipoprotein